MAKFDDNDEWVELYGGFRFSFSGQHDIKNLTIGHIAAAMCQMNRYRGHSVRPVSLAEHSILVARECHRLAHNASHPDPQLVALYGLMHDVEELVVSDIPRPLKIRMKKAGMLTLWEDVERLATMTFLEHFDIPFPVPEPITKIIEKADGIALSTEARTSMIMTHDWGTLPPKCDYWNDIVKKVCRVGPSIAIELKWAQQFVAHLEAYELRRAYSWDSSWFPAIDHLSAPLPLMKKLAHLKPKYPR